jgi:hypothetical protein
MAFTDPKWFDSTYYMAQKLAQLQKTEPEKGWTADMVATAFAANGFVDQKDGSTAAYAHFTAFGAAEDVAPNQYFNANEYYYAKAAQYFGVETATATQAAAVAKMIQDTGMNAWTHYQQFGSTEGVNPSNAFDAKAYLAAKAAAMGGDWTADSIAKAIADNGMTVLEHYMQFAGAGDGEVAAGATFPVSGGVVVTEPIYLTVDQDILSGTSGNDTFNATIFDNQNTLQSGDRIDGGAGHDVLNADLGTSALFAATPEIKNVEVIKFRAQANATDNGSNNVANDAAARIDAERIQAGDDGKLQLWSQDSRADLVIEDVRVNSNNVTIGMSNTDAGDVDMNVYFDPQHLKADNATTTGTLNLQLIDTVGALTEAQGGHNDPLYDNPYTGFKFTLNGTEYSLDFKAYNHTTDETPSYAELAAQIQAAIDADATLSKLGLTVATDGDFVAKVGIGDYQGTEVTGTQIVVRSSQGALTGGNWVASNGLPETNSTSATMTVINLDSCPLIKTDVALDNVGRVQWNDASNCLPSNDDFGSQAGDLVIGSMATRGGVERFDVTVDQGSWLSSMSSTNNTLRMVTVKNGDLNGDGINGNVGVLANNASAEFGQLYIGDSQETGDLMVSWQDAPKLLSSTGLTDVKSFDGSEFQGRLNIGAQLTENSHDKYLKDVDGVNSMAEGYAPNGPFKYLLGSNDDTLNLVVDGAIAADNDFELQVNGGAGNDTIFTTLKGQTKHELHNQHELANITIHGDAGNDEIHVQSQTDFWNVLSMFEQVVNASGEPNVMSAVVGNDANNSHNINATSFLFNGLPIIGETALGHKAFIYGDDGNDVIYSDNTGGSKLINPERLIAKFGDDFGIKTILDVVAGIKVAVGYDAGDVSVSGEVDLSGFATALKAHYGNLSLDAFMDAIGADFMNSVVTSTNAVFVFNSDADNPAVDVSMVNGAQPLNNDILSQNETYHYSQAGGESSGHLEVTVNFKGLTSTVTVTSWGANTSTTDAVNRPYTELDINKAIIEAINNDDILGKLLVAKDGSGASLIVESLIDGQMDENDLTFNFAVKDSNGKDIANATVPTHNGYGEAQFATASDVISMEGIGDVTLNGRDSVAISSNVIDGGTENDLIVLSTGANSNETVKFIHNFGHDTIVNFTADEGVFEQNPADKMDFSSFFGTGKMAASITDNVLTNNSVVSFTGASAADADSNGLTVAEVISYINSDSVNAAASEEAGDILFLVKGIAGAEGDYYVFSADVAKDGAITGAIAEGSITLAGIDETTFNITSVALA